MDNCDLVETVFLDLSKAFDLVSHDILIARLSKNHTGPTAINLSERRQVCSVSGVLSSPASLPQGSILGPLPISVYYERFASFAEVDIYADDTTICQVELPQLKYNKL